MIIKPNILMRIYMYIYNLIYLFYNYYYINNLLILYKEYFI